MKRLLGEDRPAALFGAAVLALLLAIFLAALVARAKGLR